MKLQLHRKYKKLFLTPQSKFNEKSKVDIVLSPQLYWCRIFEIPVTKVKKATKALPILFEDILPTKNFKFQCRKLQANSYMAFAYNDTDIIEAIENSGLSLSQIKNIYLAQGQMIKYSSFQTDENYYRYINQILVHLPYKIEDSYEKLNNYIDNDLKIDKINIQLYANFIKKKYLETLFILLFMTSLLSVFKILQYNQELSKNEEYLRITKHNYNLPPSNILFASILNNLKQSDTHKKNFKKKFTYLLSYGVQNKDVIIEKIEYKDNKLLFSYSNTDEKNLEAYLQKKIEKFTINIQNNQIQIEVAL